MAPHLLTEFLYQERKKRRKKKKEKEKERKTKKERKKNKKVWGRIPSQKMNKKRRKLRLKLRRWDFFEEVFGVDVVIVFGFGGGVGEVLRVGEVVGGRLGSSVLCFRGGGGVVFLPFVELPPPLEFP